MQFSVCKNLFPRKKISVHILVKKCYKEARTTSDIYTSRKIEILVIVQRALKNDPGSRKQANLQHKASTFQLIQLLKEKN